MLSPWLVVLLAAAPDPAACLPVPVEVAAQGDQAVVAHRAQLATKNPKAPTPRGAPTDALPLLQLVWSVASKASEPSALRWLMEPEFTWSFGGDASAEQAVEAWAKDPALLKKLKAAAAGPCKAVDSAGTPTLTCAAKRGPRLVLAKKDGCWRWTAFVEGD